MTTPSDKALANALHCEAKKHAYRQTQDGVVVSFVLHPQEVPDGLATASLGTRYMIALVEIGDDELPVAGAVALTARRSTANEIVSGDRNPGGSHALTPNASHHETGASQDEPAPVKPRMEWRELQPSAQAAIRCDDPVFWAFLREDCEQPRVENKEDAAQCVRKICCVNTRAAFNTNHSARVLWTALDNKFGAWKMAEQMA